MAGGEKPRRVPLGSDEPERQTPPPGDARGEFLGPEEPLEPLEPQRPRRFPLNTVGNDSGNTPDNPGNNILPVPGNRGVTR